MDGGAFDGSFPHARQLSDVVRSSVADEALCARGTFGRTLLHARQLSDVVRSSAADGGLCPRDGVREDCPRDGVRDGMCPRDGVRDGICPRDGVRDGMCPRDGVRDDGDFQLCHSVSRVDSIDHVSGSLCHDVFRVDLIDHVSESLCHSVPWVDKIAHYDGEVHCSKAVIHATHGNNLFSQCLYAFASPHNTLGVFSSACLKSLTWLCRGTVAFVPVRPARNEVYEDLPDEEER